MAKPPHGAPNPVEKQTVQVFKDPVCGMDVNPQKSYSTAHGEREFRFCSLSCLEKFKANPEIFIER
jgi:Cu+-exporting ATPase